jgi:hypothetical protein
MALVVKDRVRETSTTSGTGSLTLNGAVTGFQSFSAIGDGNTTYYTIVDAGTGVWEVGIGIYTSATTSLSRDTVLESSSGGSLVNFGSNLKDVFVTYPAERSIYTDAAGTAITPATASVLGVASGGTGQSTYTDGQLLIGNSTGNTLAKSTLTAGTGISITNGSGSITVAATNNGDVVGPASSTDNAIARFDSTTGKIIQNSGVIVDDSNNVTGVVGQTMSGNLNFSSTSQRIIGDFSNATVANRVMFQTSTVNGNTVLSAIPNGTGTITQLAAYGGSDPANAQVFRFDNRGGTESRIESTFAGTPASGTYLPMTFYTGGGERMRVDTSGNVGIGTSSPTNRLTVVNSANTGTATDNVNIEVTSTNRNSSITLNGNASHSGNVIFADGGVEQGRIGYTNSTDTMFFNVNGAERMRIDNIGRVSIGTPTPASNVLQTLQFDNGTINTATVATAYGVSPSAVYRNAGGTAASPSASSNNPMNIVGGTTSDGTTFFNTISVTGVIESTPTSGSHPTALTFSTTPSGSTSRVQRMVITSGGNVGIGDAAPGVKFVVSGAGFNGGSANFVSTNSGNGIQVTGVNGAGINDSAFLALADQTNNAFIGLTGTNAIAGALRFATAGSERMRIHSGGNVSIGGTSNIWRFDINNTFGTGPIGGFYTDVAQNAYFGGSPANWRSRNGGPGMIIQHGGGSSSLAFYSIQMASNAITDAANTVLTLATAFYIDNVGKIYCVPTYNNTSGAAANMGIDASGTLYRSTSSRKYKTEITSAVHGLADLMKLRSVTYKGTAKMDGDTVFGGLIAEEVHDAGLTEFVQYAEDGTPDALAYGNMVALCVKAIQELKAELDSLKGN